MASRSPSPWKNLASRTKFTRWIFPPINKKSPGSSRENQTAGIPAITDTLDGEKTRLFESGSILQYLVEEYDAEHKISYPRGSRESYEVNNWLFFQNAGVGPMQGQANHFVRYAPEKMQYGMDRYTNETRRLDKVLNTHLEKSKAQWLVGDKCTVADISYIGWVHWAGWAGVDVEDLPHLRAWRDRMLKRPGSKRGMMSRIHPR